MLPSLLETAKASEAAWQLLLGIKPTDHSSPFPSPPP